jgi:hypothetical protein
MFNQEAIERARQIRLANARQQAQQEYEAQKAQLDQKYNGGGLGGFLGNIVGGIGKGIGDVGYALGGMFGTAGASVKDLLEGKAGTGENQLAFKRAYYNAKDDKDAALKAAGNSLNAATTLATTVVPGMAGGTATKLGTSALANSAAGAIGGIADEFAQQGANASLESAANRAISGAAAGLATGGLNRKIGNATSNLGSKLLNNKLATSALGRGALSGAVGGATGAGTSAALGGGDVAQAALQGGLTGAVSGGTQAGIMNVANNVLNRIGNRNTATPTTETTTQSEADKLGLPDYTKPRDYQGNEIKIEKKNVVQKLGDSLSKTGERIENADLYNSLYSKTAAQVTKNDTVNKLRKLGYTPENYGEAAKISTTTNKFVDDIVKNSGATIVDNDLVDRIAQPSSENTIATPAYQKVYDEQIKQVFNTIENGDIPGKYNASDLLKASRQINKVANKYLKKATSVNGGDLATDAGALADALMDVKYELRNLATKSVDGFGDNYTKNQLSQRLKNLGATDAAIADMMEAKNIGEFIAKTAKYEDARQMNYEMKSNELRRNAISGSKTNANLLNRLSQDSGAGELISVATRPVGKLIGKGARMAGNAISTAGSALGDLTTTTTPIDTNTQLLINNLIGRTQGQKTASDMIQNARKAEDYQNLDNNYAAIQNEAQLAQQQPVSIQRQNTSQLDNIANAMNAALSAGDISAYNQLASLYQTAYKIYEAQNPQTATSNISTAEKNQLAKLQSAGTALDELEALYTKAGGGQGVIGGNIANFLGGLGLNSDVNTYNQLAQGLINQIGAAIGKTDSLNTEGEVQRALSLVPKITDDNQTAMNKLATLRSLLQTNTGTYNQLYGM